MAARGFHRGHAMHFDEGAKAWRYDDDNTAVADAPDRTCGYCGVANTPEGHDGCLGTLRDVTNACCGHGRGEEAYVVLDDGKRLAGVAAIEFFQLVSARDYAPRGKGA